MSTITASQEQQVVDRVPKQLYIAGEWRDGAKGTFEVEDPPPANPCARSPTRRSRTPSPRLTAAVDAFPAFAAMAPRDRGEILRRAFELIIERKQDLALLMTLEMGKSVTESLGEIAYAAEFFRWFSEESVRIHGRYAVAANGAGRVLTMQQPVGPCLFITPWNFPLAMGTRKIGPAIAAGCTMVVKPAGQTPLSMLALAQILEEAGLPGGVLNLFTATASGETTAPLIADPRLRKLSFTGSTEVGRRLMAGLLGDAAATVDGARWQRPLPGLRGRRRRRRRPGRDARQDAQRRRGLHGRQPLPRLGRGRRRVHVEAGGEDGRAEARSRRRRRRRRRTADRQHPAPEGLRARHRRDRQGRARRRRRHDRRRRRLLLQPDRAQRRPGNAELLQEEIFGPVAPIIGFDDEDAAIAAANNTEYGLVAYVFTSDLKRALRVCERLETGMIGLNQGMVSNAQAPFGGVKQSGFGREGGSRGDRGVPRDQVRRREPLMRRLRCEREEA